MRTQSASKMTVDVLGSIVDEISAWNTNWFPMAIEGQFILLMAANAYMSNDFEYSLRVSL